MITKSLLAKLDTLQLKGLRKILGLKTMYIDRSSSNKRVFELTNAQKNPTHKPNKDIKSFSHYVKTKQHELLAHVIRAPNEDPLREATLEPDTGIPVHVHRRRVGRPRDNWTWTSIEELYLLNGQGTPAMFKADREEGAGKVETLARNRSIRC